jgi:serine/threonine protein phosphatase 1
LVFKTLTARRKRLPPRLPDGIRVYAIGDIHGRIDLLDRVLSRIDAHEAAYPAVRPVEVFIGDYIDRGPESRAVLDRLINRSDSRETVCLKGNHETLILEFLENPASLRDWSQLGGRETLMSYGIAPPIKADDKMQKELADALKMVMPKAHTHFLENLPSSFSCGDFFFAHAGVKPGVLLTKQQDSDLLWIRDEFLLYEEDFGKIIIHGHTPVLALDIRSNRINIDTGAYATGKLTCLMIEAENYEAL